MHVHLNVRFLVTLLDQVIHLDYIIIIIIIDVACHTPFLPGASLERAVIHTAQVSSFTLQYFPYYA